MKNFRERGKGRQENWSNKVHQQLCRHLNEHKKLCGQMNEKMAGKKY